MEKIKEEDFVLLLTVNPTILYNIKKNVMQVFRLVKDIYDKCKQGEHCKFSTN